MHQVAESLARAAAQSRARGAGHPALPWFLGAGLWTMGCQPAPAAPSTTGEASVTTGAPGEAPKPVEARPGGSLFVEVADGPCEHLPYRFASSVRDGTLIITYTQGAKRSSDSDYSVEAGDGSEALMVSTDGVVSPFPSWPNVLLYDRVLATDGVLWAMTIRPGMSGNFVLRLPLAGTPEYFLVPGTQGCHGKHRLFYPAKLVEEGATAHEVMIEYDYSDHLAECLTKGADGRLRLRTPGARWSKQPGGTGDGLGKRVRHAKPDPVKVGDATLRVEGTRVLYTGPGTEGERDADPDPPGDPADERDLVVTKGSSEVWLQTRRKTRCRLGRYRSW